MNLNMRGLSGGDLSPWTMNQPGGMRTRSKTPSLFVPGSVDYRPANGLGRDNSFLNPLGNANQGLGSRKSSRISGRSSNYPRMQPALLGGDQMVSLFGMS